MSDIKNKPNGELIEGHEYDGIQELDHPLPKWWLNLFYGTIIFSVMYVVYYNFYDTRTVYEKLDLALAQLQQEKNKFEHQDNQEILAVNVEDILKDAKLLALGAESYQQVCAACHGSKGEGLVGPNLTDKYWIHSKGEFVGILQAILKGFPDKGMPPWEAVVPKDRHAPLAAYVMSLQGTTPQNPKAPQGDLIN